MMLDSHSLIDVVEMAQLQHRLLHRASASLLYADADGESSAPLGGSYQPGGSGFKLL